ncbi:FabD/lysophospholipase-like protein [Gymnopus androsaceus JB14]|uniref:Lysophospholipase n=1 Tax=Gymnopus androsaceus JB14 TaxID=1447944 RepID=A0A6A4HT06_9AGAR|nr:FabD/lysophospholipase-like protein [Gymnopus androsaceus JB14]
MSQRCRHLSLMYVIRTNLDEQSSLTYRPRKHYSQCHSFKLAASISLTGNYTPTYIQCPSNVTFVRPASDGLSDNETEWRTLRTPMVVDSLQSYLKNVNITDFDIDAYISALGTQDSAVPIIGFTLSGGGTRAEMSAFGMLRAFDNRSADSVNAGTGGLLQAATYVSGLSGGGTALGLIAMSDFQALDESLQQGLVNYTPPANTSIYNEIAGKAQQGFNISITDILGVGDNFHSLQIANSSVNQYSRLWSDIQSFPGFSSALTPMAILMLNEVIPAGLPGSASYNGTLIPSQEAKFNGTFGSWQGRAQAFTPIQYIGVQYLNGQPINNTCVNGFDTAAFVVGSADTAVNTCKSWYTESQTNGTVGQFARRDKIPYPPNEDVIEQLRTEDSLIGFVEELPQLLQLLGLTSEPTSEALYAYWPNPFAQYEHSDTGLQSQKDILLVDGSEYWQPNPLPPLLQKARGLDFIIVNDAGGSELSTGWANGTGLHNSADMARTFGLPFPKIPSVYTMLNLNPHLVPRLLRLRRNRRASYAYSNITVLGTDFDNSQISLLWNNTLTLYSQDNNQLAAKLDHLYRCGAIQRSLGRLGMEIPDVCKQCFEKHCWHGEVDDSQPGFLSPSLILDPSETWTEWNISFFGSTD